MNLFGNSSSKDNTQDKKVIDTIRALGIDMIDNAKSGHPGIVLGAAPIIYTVFANHLNFDKNNPKWFNRDRFIMSCGHGSALLYSCLYMAGFNYELDDLKHFRKKGTKTPGHPEYNVDYGIEMTTGPLGQGLASSVGLAVGEAYLSNYFGSNIMNHYTYVLCSDGDLMEGISYEALSVAGKLGLNKLIVLYDSNDVTLDGPLSISTNENTRLRMESINWNYILVNDGENIDEIDSAINKAKSSDKPTLIEVKTILGRFSKYQGTNTVHGKPLDEEDIKTIKEKMDLRDITFAPSMEVVDWFRNKLDERCNGVVENWNLEYEKLDDEKKNQIDELIDFKNSVSLKDVYYEMPEDNKESTRVTSGKILNAFAEKYPFIIGGSADISSSTYGKINDMGDFDYKNPSGRNIYYGVREHAMAAISNGIGLMGISSFASCQLAFSDYMKPAIRMSAMMDLPVLYILTHDSITVGEDGPTHQPVEQLVGLRSIPNLDVYRPGDANEVLGSYKAIFEKRRPAALVLCRNGVPMNENTSVKDVSLGAYILEEERGDLQGIIISSGEDLLIATDVHRRLVEKGYNIRLVSMPSIEVFEKQPNQYKNKILPDVKTFVIEASSSYSWYKYVDSAENLFNVNSFGMSAKYQDIYDKFGMTADKIEEKIIKLMTS